MRIRAVLVALATVAVATFGVGCTAEPPSEWQQQNQMVGIGNFLFFLIYSGLCQANGGTCPFPIAPSDPPGPVAPPVPVTPVVPVASPEPAVP